MRNYFRYFTLAQEALSIPFHSNVMHFHSANGLQEKDGDSRYEEILVKWAQ